MAEISCPTCSIVDARISAPVWRSLGGWSRRPVWQDSGVLGHVGLNVPDLAGAQAYYDDLLPLLGLEMFLASDDQCAYKPAGGKPGTYVFFYPAADATPYSCDKTGLQHLAFMVKTRGDVDRVHRHVLSVGGKVIHPPRVFPEYPPPYYATFWLDPFGIMLEAVCHYDRD
jgi:catechol 2,3-dioxygenase-like lactoylglutathione lyase family enzyme